jgi:hypothetical protein
LLRPALEARLQADRSKCDYQTENGAVQGDVPLELVQTTAIRIIPGESTVPIGVFTVSGVVISGGIERFAFILGGLAQLVAVTPIAINPANTSLIKLFGCIFCSL